MEVARTVSCKNIRRATVHEKSPTRRIFITSVFVVLYAIVLPYAWNTMGEPLRRAKEEALALNHEKLSTEIENFDEVTVTWDESADTDEITGDDDSDAYLDQSDNSWSAEGLEEPDGAQKNESVSNDLNGTDDNNERPLPSPFLPDAGAVASLFLLLTAHALFSLLRIWLVSFEIRMFYHTATKIEAGCFVHIVPYPYRGKPAIAVIEKNKRTGKLEFEFQRQKFVISGPTNAAALEVEGEVIQIMEGDEAVLEPQEIERRRDEAKDIAIRVGYIMPFSSRVNDIITTYTKSRGIESDAMLIDLIDRFGTNTIRMESATIYQLIKNQLLSPLAMFQLFSASLWLMDEYWQQTLFTIFTIILMESTTAFQRWRTMNILKGLAPKPYQIPVYRKRKWMLVFTNELLPGDIISLTANKGSLDGSDPSRQMLSDVVPCDCLILHGSAVVNEATLTGESVPQMKDAINPNANGDSPLDINGRDRVHVLFSGTSLVSASPPEKIKGENPIEKSPDNGCICLVLRTGFGSSQGELMQMIEFSTETVTSDTKETGIALLILLAFALVSAGYVFKKGMEKGDRTTHELLLKCIIIITSVVPQTLPVQMAAAVNMALMALMKEGIFCTEPYRMPLAGKVTHCLFDKTGTLTSDELVPVGIINVEGRKTSENACKALSPVMKASGEAAMVLAACHALIEVPGASDKKSKTSDENHAKQNLRQELLGDPIEIAAMKGVNWSFDPKAQIATPGDYKLLEAAVGRLTARLSTPQQPPLTADQQNATKAQLAQIEGLLKEAKDFARKSPIQEIKILHRYHFSSTLQRMCVVCKVKKKGGNMEENPLSLVKGSPEAIRSLLLENQIPSWYDSTYRELAEEGMRVLALAYKQFGTKVAASELSREDAERDLSFAGFIAFECKTRADSPIVVQSLRDAALGVAMLTGDAPLTALHVAKETSIIDVRGRQVCPLLLTALELQNSTNGATKDTESLSLRDYKLEWVTPTGDQENATRIEFEKDVEGCGLCKLSEKYDLLTTEKALLIAELQSNGRIWSEIDNIKVFARMSPQGKAKVIRKLQDDTRGEKQKFVLMCGDGGNDVGALKQADVGLALLSGYGNANTEGKLQGNDKTESAEVALNDQANKLRTLQRKAMKDKQKEFEAKRKEIMGKQQQMLEEELRRRAEMGLPTGVSAHFQAVKKVTMDLREELKKENAKLDRKYNVFLKNAQGTKDADMAAQLALESLGDDGNALPIVRPGDASVAAPFTSRTPSISSVVHMIRQGRCTLLSALQQQQIMMLESTISAYCLAALSLEGARSSERQLIASSWLVLTAVGAFSYAAPIDRMHPVKPLRSLFHPGIILSIVGQAAIHLFCIVHAVRLATETMGPEKLQEVINFNRKVSAGLEKQMQEKGDEYNPLEEFMTIWSTPFKPNLLNTVVFLVQTAQTMSVFFVNYKGRPWMKGLLENHMLFLSLFICIGGIATLAWEVLPWLNKMIHLEPFPNDTFRWQVMGLIGASIVGTFIVDRVVTALFAPKIFGAMLEEGRKTTFADVVPIFVTLFKVVGGFLIVGSGNPIVWFGAWWLYRKRQAMIEAAEEAKLS